jgi:hypothetical protein
LSRASDNLFELTGDKAMARKLDKLAKGAQNKVARPALRTIVRVVAKGQKGAAPLPVIKRTIGYRVKGDVAKAGVEVGKKTPRPKKTGAATNLRGRAAMWLGHLFTLGTKVRTAGFTTRAKGRRGEMVATGKPVSNRGQILPHKFLKSATTSALPGAIAAGAAVAKQKLEELAKG